MDKEAFVKEQTMLLFALNMKALEKHKAGGGQEAIPKSIHDFTDMYLKNLSSILKELK